MRIKNISGFTLIEILISIGILGVLITSVIIVLNPLEQIQKSQDARMKSDLSQIQKSLDVYYSDFGSYPSNDTSFRILNGATAVNWGSVWPSTVAGGTPYMSLLPKDTVVNHSYQYYSPAGGQSYYLYANLNRGVKDSQKCNATATSCPNVPASAACVTGGGVNSCNYGVSSSNTSP